MDTILAVLNSVKGFRTLIVQGLVAVFGILVALGVVPATEYLLTLSPEQLAQEIASRFDAILGGAITLTAAIAILMRAITKSPVGTKPASAKEGGVG